MADEPEAVEHLAGAGFRQGGLHSVHHAEGQGHVLQRGEVGEQVVALEDEAVGATLGERSGFVVGQFLGIHEHAAGVGHEQASEHAKESRFAPAGRAEEGDNAGLALRFERDAVQGAMGAEGFHHVAGFKFHRRTSFRVAGPAK